MALDVALFDIAQNAREAASQFLEADPVGNNVILTLLTAHALDSQPGRYWIVYQDGGAAGMAFQSSLDRPLILASMKPDAARALGHTIAAGNFDVPGAIGEAATASHFADAWAKRSGHTAEAAGWQRIYEVQNLVDGPASPGKPERAAAKHVELVRTWIDAFFAEIGEPSVAHAEWVAQRISAGEFWLWNHIRVRCMAAATAPEQGICRLQYVYTRPEHRRNGYAESLVRCLTGKLLQSGHRVMLYADSGNPTANGIYARIGYRASAEVIRYRFVPGKSAS